MRIVLKSLLLALLFIPMQVSAQKNYLNDPMVRIAMSAYAAQIEANPNDYSAYFSRANEYFRYGEKDLALADFDKAIALFPQSETAELSQAYTMRALIHQEKGNYNEALSDFNEALKLDPQSYYSLLGRADMLYDSGDYAHAKGDYEMLLRRDPRCQEALLGLARVAYKEQNIGSCKEYLEKARNANPSNANFYVQRGGFYEVMGEHENAANDYLTAMFYGDNSNSAVALGKLAKVNYNAVNKALTTVIETAEDKGYYCFIRATINKNNYHYSASIQDWNTIIENKYFYHNTIFANRAYCYMRLGQFDYAINDISKAIVMKGDEMSYYLLRGVLYRLQGMYDKAAEDLSLAATFDPTNVELLQEQGLLAMEQNDYETAATYYNDAVMYNAENARSYLLRADNNMLLGNNEAAVRDYEMMLNIPEEKPSIASLRGFALARLGHIVEAEAWMEAVIEAEGEIVDAEMYYYAACLYALSGNKLQAYSYLEKAFDGNYGDYYNIYFECDSPVSLAPLRNERDFSDLVRNYQSIF